MYYVIIGMILLLSILFLVKVELKIEKKEEVFIFLIIGKLYKKRLNQGSNSNFELKDILEIIKKLNQSIVNNIFKSSSLKKIEIEAGFKIDDSPYVIFLGHMILLTIRNELSSMFKKVKKESYNVVINNKKLEGKLILSISLLKLVTIILSNYQEFKMIIKKGE